MERELGQNEKIMGLNLSITGDDNLVVLDAPFNIGNLNIRTNANHSKTFIGKGTKIDYMWCEICGGNNQCIRIGDNCTILGLTIQASEENASFILGKNSLVSFNVTAWCSDSHTVISPDGSVANHITKPLELGEHCWVGYGATLYKNTKLAKNSVVAGSSVVTKSFEQENIVIAGNPAKKIKENINWDIQLPYKFIPHKEN